MGVVAIAISPTAAAQQAIGAEARSSSTRNAAGAVPVRRATCAAAMAIPAPNQAAYEGSHMVCRPLSSQPIPIRASHPAVTNKPPQTITTVRTGRHDRPTASTATSGRIR
jgi:hypothetical protein